MELQGFMERQKIPSYFLNVTISNESVLQRIVKQITNSI